MGARFDAVSTAFKEVEGGYLFKLNPWLFGHAHVYLVDEAKRAEIISQMERNRHAIDRAKQRAKVFLMFGAMGSLFFKSWHWASGWPLDRFTTFTVLVLVPFLGFMISVHIYMARKLRLLSANLSRIDDIAYREWFRVRAEADPSPASALMMAGGLALVFFTMFALLLEVVVFEDPPDVGGSTFVALMFFLTLPILFFASVAIWWFALAISKRTQHGTARAREPGLH